MTPQLLFAAMLAVALPDSTVLPRRAPETVGMSSERLSEIDRVLRLGLDASGYPGASVIVGRHGAIVYERGVGSLDGDGREPVRPRHTVYDLASITKAVATATAAMVLWDHGQFDLDDRVGRWLPTYRSGSRASVTMRQLLRHRSGLPAGAALFRHADSPAEARRRVLDVPLAWSPGDRGRYSDVGYEVLGIALETVAGERLDTMLRRSVFVPLDMRATGYAPVAARTAPTGYSPVRPGLLRGRVHDEDAAALGGVAGHAGLFSTAWDLARFAQMILDGGRLGGVRIASDSAVSRFIGGGAGEEPLGWERCDGGACGQYLGDHAIGHTGFTGTSLWIDPDLDLFVIVLTNRVLMLDDEGGSPPIAILHDVRADIVDLAALAVADGGAPTRTPRLRSDLAIGWRR
ncbi:MAG TPA: serine hydrolase [Gemmatimonadaceae bacterium]|nr:serine hydrolase [Gemmatimonadaceae bacterium]